MMAIVLSFPCTHSLCIVISRVCGGNSHEIQFFAEFVSRKVQFAVCDAENMLAFASKPKRSDYLRTWAESGPMKKLIAFCLWRRGKWANVWLLRAVSIPFHAQLLIFIINWNQFGRRLWVQLVMRSYLIAPAAERQKQNSFRFCHFWNAGSNGINVKLNRVLQLCVSPFGSFGYDFPHYTNIFQLLSSIRITK